MGGVAIIVFVGGGIGRIGDGRSYDGMGEIYIL